MALIDEDVGKALSDELSQQRMRCDAGWGELEDIVMAKDAFSVAAAGAVDELLYFTDRSQIGFEICDLLFEAGLRFCLSPRLVVVCASLRDLLVDAGGYPSRDIRMERPDD